MLGEMYMRSFEDITMHVTARQAAEAYGLKPDKRGMARCIFHTDRRPSMKLDERFYCFGCGRTGDAIDLTAGIFGLDLKEAAEKLADDFGLTDQGLWQDKRKRSDKEACPEKKEPQADPWDRKLEFYKDILLYHLRLLAHYKERYAPDDMEEEWDDRFSLALDQLPVVGYQLDILFFGTEEEQKALVEELERGEED